MNSADLQRRGFTTWLRFNLANAVALIQEAPTAPGVYCIRCTSQRFSFSSGASDILYIGSAANRQGLQMRLQQYFRPGPTQWTNKRLLTRCGNSEDYELSFVTCESGSAAQHLESELLRRFMAEHGQLPPENRQLPDLPSSPPPPSKAQRMFDAIAKAPMGAKTRQRFEQMVASGDCAGILRYLENCINHQKSVGRSIQRAGLVSFEDQMPLVRRIYDEP